MADALIVLLDDRIAGAVTRLSGGRLRFDYDEEYRASEGSTPRVHPIQNTWPKAARELGLDPGLVADRVLALARRAPDAFSESAGASQVFELDSSLPARLVDLVAERCERCIGILDSSPVKIPDGPR